MTATQAERETALANEALVLLGQDGRFTAGLDSTANAAAPRANAVYPTVRDTLLAKHPWNFALDRAEVAADDDAPAFGWQRRFALPDDLLRVWRLNDKDEQDVRWTVERGWLLTDEASPVNLRYIARVADPENWTPAFRTAVITELAVALSLGLTNTASRVQVARAEADRALADARWIDGQEQGAHEWLEGRFLQARRRVGI